MRSPLIYLILIASLSLSGCKTMDLKQVSDVIQQYQTPLNEATVADGLKQALEIGTRNSVAATSRKGGFSNNSLIKIGVPQELNKVASTLRKVGLGSYVDKLELQMNRAAEKASGEAKSVFLESLAQMSVADAWGILKGPNDAATQYFKRTTGTKLSSRFAPIIQNSMSQVGFYGDYQSLLSAYDKIPFTQKPNLNIEDYILTKTLDGVFSMVAQEEEKIRENPAARVTQLLQRVFSQQG